MVVGLEEPEKQTKIVSERKRERERIREDRGIAMLERSDPRTYTTLEGLD